MLSNERLRLVLSLLLAVVLWGYVAGAVDPQTTKHFGNVPIVYIGEETLTEAGLAAPEEVTADILLGGHRSDLVALKKGDIVITADLSEAKEGENEIELNVEAPSGVRVERMDPGVLVVTIAPASDVEEAADEEDGQ